MKKQKPKVINTFSLLTEHDIYLFKEGSHFRLYEKLGSHITEHEGVKGTFFAVWAPNAESVSVIGNFNNWNYGDYPLNTRWDGSGIWEGFIPGIDKGALYKYHIVSRTNNYTVDKNDPFAFYCELPPGTSIINGTIRPGCKIASRQIRSTPQSAYTRSTLAPGSVTLQTPSGC